MYGESLSHATDSYDDDDDITDNLNVYNIIIACTLLMKLHGNIPKSLMSTYTQQWI